MKTITVGGTDYGITYVGGRPFYWERAGSEWKLCVTVSATILSTIRQILGA